MAAPAYSTDLATVNLLENTGSLYELTSADSGGTPQFETDYFIQNAYCADAQATKTGLASIAVDYGSNITWTSGWCVFLWGTFLTANACDTDANGGLRVMVGSAIGAYNIWYVGGRDFGRYPYGGWQNFAVDPETTVSTTAVGSPGAGQYRWFGFGVKVTAAVARGYPIGLDAIRYGRGEIKAESGESGNYATFTGMAAKNDANDASAGYNRWGLFQAIDGGFLWKGLMSLGTTGTAVDFRDANKNIVVDNTRRVTSGFNKINVNHASSRVDWTGISIAALGTVSKGSFECVANADINWESCTFTDMNAFTFQSNSTVNQTIFRRCGLVTTGGGAITNCTFDQPSGAVGVATAALSSLADCVFVSDGTGHAVDLGTVANTTTMTWDCVDSGYGSTGTANATIKVSVSSGQTLTINVGAGKSTPTYYNVGSGSVSVVSGQITLTLTGLLTGSDIVIKTSDTNTALVNIDQNSGSTYAYIYTYAASTYVDITIMKAGYKPLTIYDFLLADSNASLPIAQVIDRAYV